MFFTSFALVSELQSPYNSIKILPLNVWGWFGLQNQKHIEKIIAETKPKKAVEVGTWLGLSALFIAKRLPSDAILFCIDPWVPYKDMENMPECQEPLKTAYEQFLSNCIHNGLTHKIIPMRMTSMEAAKTFEADIDFIYLDGSHDEDDVYDDLMEWYPRLSPTGRMCGDDIGWPSVQRAIERVKKTYNFTVHADDNFWWIERN